MKTRISSFSHFPLLSWCPRLRTCPMSSLVTLPWWRNSSPPTADCWCQNLSIQSTQVKIIVHLYFDCLPVGFSEMCVMNTTGHGTHSWGGTYCALSLLNSGLSLMLSRSLSQTLTVSVLLFQYLFFLSSYALSLALFCSVALFLNHVVSFVFQV